MHLIDYDREVLFPPTAITSYVKNILLQTKTPVTISKIKEKHIGYYVFYGQTHSGIDVELVAPFTTGSYTRLYINSIFQLDLNHGNKFRWSFGRRGCILCAKIATQENGNEFYLITSKLAVFNFLNHSSRVKAVENTLRDKAYNECMQSLINDPLLESDFRFADVQGTTIQTAFRAIEGSQVKRLESKYEKMALPNYYFQG